MKYFVIIILFLNPVIGFTQSTQERKIIQLSGLVVGIDSSNLPGCHIYSLTSGRGTVTNAYGYFTRPFVTGDSIVITAVGYRPYYYVIPITNDDHITRSFQLEEDTIYLKAVDIFPYPGEQAFKKGIINLKLPDVRPDIFGSRSGPSLQEMANQLIPDGDVSTRFYLDQQIYRTNKYMNLYNPFLDPIKWAHFIHDLKEGKYKKKNKKD